MGHPRAAAEERCLHCGSALAEPAAPCPGCGDLWPQRYSAGICHVELDSVEDPARLIGHLCDRHRGLAAADLARHCAALATGPQRLLSFVTRDQAEQVVQQLAAVGAQARVVDEPAWNWLVIGGFVAVLLVVSGAFYGPGLFVLAYLLYFFSEPLLSLLRARQSMLGASTWPRSVWPGLQRRGGLLALILACIDGSLVARTVDRVTFEGGYALLVACLATAAAVATALRLGGGAGRHSPEPPWREQLACLGHTRNAWLHRSAWLQQIPRRPPAPALRWATLAMLVVLLPLETAVLARAHGDDAAGLRGRAVGSHSSAVAPAGEGSARHHRLRASLAPQLGLLPLLLLAGVLFALGGRAWRVRRRAAALLGADGRTGPYAVVLDEVSDVDLASAWLLTELQPTALRRQGRLRGALQRLPVVLCLADDRPAAWQLVRRAARQGLRARVVHGPRVAAARWRIRQASAGALLGLGALHLGLVATLGALALLLDARLEQVLMLPVLVGLLGLALLRRLPRRPLLTRRLVASSR